MPNFGQLINPQTLLALATQTTNGTSANLTLAPGAAYRFFLRVATVSGTSPTLQVSLATSYDATAGAGTNYETFLQFVAVTTSGLGRMMTFRPYLSAGDTAAENQSALVGTADLAAGAIASNGPINSSAIKVRWVAGGTTPSFAFELGVISVSQDYSD